MEIDLDGELVRLAYHFVSNGIDNYSSVKSYVGLQSIRVEPHRDGAVIVACDAAWMFVAIDRTGYCDEPLNLSITVPIHCKLKPSEAANIRVTATRKKGLRLCNARTQFCRQDEPWIAKDQIYPNWRSIIPDLAYLKMNFPARISLRYLAQIGLIWNDTNRRTNNAVFLGRGEDSNVVVHIPAMPHIMLVGMPLKSDEPLPSDKWSKQFKQPAPEIDGDL